MKRYPDIEYSYRPVSYWHDETLTQAILKNIKGEFRRRQIRRALAEGSRPLLRRGLPRMAQQLRRHHRREEVGSIPDRRSSGHGQDDLPAPAHG